MSYSKYLSETYQTWNAKRDGVVFSAPIRKRDEKLFTKISCTFCREVFFVDCNLKPKPEACEKCFAARTVKAKPVGMERTAVPSVSGSDGPADHPKVSLS